MMTLLGLAGFAALLFVCWYIGGILVAGIYVAVTGTFKFIASLFAGDPIR